MALNTNLSKPLSLTKLLAYTVWRNAISLISFTDRPVPCQTDMRCKDTTFFLIVKWFLKKMFKYPLLHFGRNNGTNLKFYYLCNVKQAISH